MTIGELPTVDPRREAIVWDNHVCLSFNHIEEWPRDLARFRDGGFDVISVNVGDSLNTLEMVVRNAARLRRFVQLNSDFFALARTAGEITDVVAAGKMAIVLDVEGAFSIGEDISLISTYYDLGVRWMSMVYNRANLAGSGVHDAQDGGLTAFGLEIVREMDRVGLVKCCSHTGYRTAMDILTSTDRPTIFSHSNPRALCDHPRNVTNEMLDACAATGGVVCLNGVGIFLGGNDPSFERLADHVDYVVDRIGSGHVGLGLDCMFDHGDMQPTVSANAMTWPAGLDYDLEVRFYPPERLPDLAAELSRRGRSRDEIDDIFGGSLMRVAREVWR
jgi:membrane dipeptidase